MRHLIPSKIALEQEATRTRLAAALATPTLSLEEELLEVQDTTNAASQIADDVKEAGRVIEISDAMEDLAAVAGDIPAADESHTQLMEIAGNMAVAGSNIEADEIVPAMESYVGKKIAVEGIVDTARRIWENILAFIKRIWAKIEEFFYKIFGSIPRLRKRLLELENKIDDLRSTAKPEEKLEITSGVENYTVAGQGLANEGEVSKALATLHTAAEYTFNKVPAYIVDLGKKIETAIKEFDPKKGAEAAEKLRDDMEKSTKTDLPGKKEENRTPGYKTLVGDALLGNKSIVLSHWVGETQDATLGTLRRMASSGWELGNTIDGPNGKKLPEKIEMPVFTTNAMKGMIKEMLKTLEVVENYARSGKGSKEVDAQAKAIERASDAASKKFAHLQGSTKEEERLVFPYYKELLSFNAAYVKWASSPSVPMTNHTVRSLRAVTALIEKSISMHANPKKDDSDKS